MSGVSWTLWTMDTLDSTRGAGMTAKGVASLVPHVGLRRRCRGGRSVFVARTFCVVARTFCVVTRTFCVVTRKSGVATTKLVIIARKFFVVAKKNFFVANGRYVASGVWLFSVEEQTVTYIDFGMMKHIEEGKTIRNWKKSSERMSLSIFCCTFAMSFRCIYASIFDIVL